MGATRATSAGLGRGGATIGAGSDAAPAAGVPASRGKRRTRSQPSVSKVVAAAMIKATTMSVSRPPIASALRPQIGASSVCAANPKTTKDITRPKYSGRVLVMISA